MVVFQNLAQNSMGPTGGVYPKHIDLFLCLPKKKSGVTAYDLVEELFDTTSSFLEVKENANVNVSCYLPNYDELNFTEPHCYFKLGKV